LKIIDVSAKAFTCESNQAEVSHDHSHLGAPHPPKMCLFTITANDGTRGHTIVSPSVAQ